MPELPEVETVRRTLARSVIGLAVKSVVVRRSDVIHGPSPKPDRFTEILRHGKQLALVGDTSCISIHLGMTGSLRYQPDGHADSRNHVHVIWKFTNGATLAFRDPRRFGGIWTFRNLDDLRTTRWNVLGDDALTITPARLQRALAGTQRAVKAVLLDQQVIAGLGNIYVDELLFAQGIHPLMPTDRLDRSAIGRMAGGIRHLLAKAIRAGGSTLRDYEDADGKPGAYMTSHRVYDRAGNPCPRCQSTLEKITVAGRSTTLCPKCQLSAGSL